MWWPMSPLILNIVLSKFHASWLGWTPDPRKCDELPAGASFESGTVTE